jgi:hypothetical protein
MTEQPDFIQQYSTEVQELVQEARSLVLQTYPGVCEQVDVPSKLFAYGYGSRMKEMLCVIMPVKQGLNLGFYGGVDLPDPAGLLQGTGKRHRHVRIQSSAELHAPAVHDLLAAALQAWQARNPQGAPR